MKDILHKIVRNNHIHAKWLNTLSYMENVGARKISACEHPLSVDIIQLKHAAEEHRHAYYLKKQIAKLDLPTEYLCKHYKTDDLLASIFTQQYLHALDIQCSRYCCVKIDANKSSVL